MKTKSIITKKHEELLRELRRGGYGHNIQWDDALQLLADAFQEKDAYIKQLEDILNEMYGGLK